MEKDFNKWNKEKKHIHGIEGNKLYGEREIWWCRLGLNVGFEQDGTGEEYERPILVLRGFSKLDKKIFEIVRKTAKEILDGSSFSPRGARPKPFV